VLVPNLNQAQCLQKAQQLALDYSQHERVISASVPSLALMTPDTVIQVSGTGTDYDMTYFSRHNLLCGFRGRARVQIFGPNFPPIFFCTMTDTGAQIGESPSF